VAKAGKIGGRASAKKAGGKQEKFSRPLVRKRNSRCG
jgi:hypothetical protein